MLVIGLEVYNYTLVLNISGYFVILCFNFVYESNLDVFANCEAAWPWLDCIQQHLGRIRMPMRSIKMDN